MDALIPTRQCPDDATAQRFAEGIPGAIDQARSFVTVGGTLRLLLRNSRCVPEQRRARIGVLARQK